MLWRWLEEIECTLRPHPLFLHPSNQPGQSLVADLFNGEDFENWRRSVTVALSAKQKLSLVDGSYKKPEAASPLLPFWQRCNDMVISWLLNSLHKNVRESVLFHNTASEIWNELNERYGQSNKARLFQAQQAVSCMTQEDLDIANFFSKARKAWDEFAVVGATPRCTCSKCECQINTKLQNYDQEQRIIQFLMGLNESYTAVRGNILMMTPFPNLSQVYSLLIQEEKQRQVKSKYDFQSEGLLFQQTQAMLRDLILTEGLKEGEHLCFVTTAEELVTQQINAISCMDIQATYKEAEAEVSEELIVP